MAVQAIKVRVNQNVPKEVHAVITGSGGGTSAQAQAAWDTANAAYAAANACAQTTGDIFTGPVYFNSDIKVANVLLHSASYNAATNSSSDIDSFSTSEFRSAKYEIQLAKNSDFHVIEIRVLHNSTNVWLAQYGEMYTNTALGIFDASIVTGNLKISVTPTYSNTKITFIRHTIDI